MSNAANNSYLGFPCDNCKQPVLALTIPRDMDTPKMTKGAMRLQCTRCGTEEVYPVAGIRRFEAAQISG